MITDPEICAECGEITHFPEKTISISGGERKAFHPECWLDRCFQEAHPEEDEVTEDDCF